MRRSWIMILLKWLVVENANAIRISHTEAVAADEIADNIDAGCRSVRIGAPAPHSVRP
jgi:hypothetical protein